MKKILFLFAFAIVSLFTYSQSTVLLRGDTIKVYKQGGTAVLRVDSIIMLTKYRQASSTDSILRWDPVSKTLKMSDASSISASGGFFNPNQTSSGATSHNALYNSFEVLKLGQTHWKSGTGVNYMDEAYDSTYHAMVVNKGSEYYGWEANSSIGNKFIKLYAHNTNDGIVTVLPDSIKFTQTNGVYGFDNVPTDNTIENVYGVDGSGHLVKRSAIIVNESNLGQDYLIKYDTAASEYQTFNPNIMLGRIEFKMAEDTWLDLGDSVIVDSNFIDKTIYALQVDGTWLTAKPGEQYYEHNSATGELIIHPAPTSDSTKISIYTIWTPMFSTLTRRVAPPPVVWTEINYETQTNLAESPANTWYPTTGSNWGQTGLNDAYKIPSGGEGAYRIQRTSASQWYCAIGLGTADTQVGYASFTSGALLVDLGGGVFDIYRTSGASTFDTGVSLAVGDYMALWRYSDGTIKIRKSTDGTNWTDVYSYGVVSSADMFFKCDLNYVDNVTSYGIMFNPQVYGQTNQ